MNEYKVVFYNHNISDGYIQVIRGILAKSDNHAIEKIMDTWNIYKNWVISTSVIKLNRKVTSWEKDSSMDYLPHQRWVSR